MYCIKVALTCAPSPNNNACSTAGARYSRQTFIFIFGFLVNSTITSKGKSVTLNTARTRYVLNTCR